MTAQVSDQFSYQEKCYSIAGIRGTGLFEPEAHGFEAVGVSTANWRGFQCWYEVQNERLVLDALEISFGDPIPPLLQRFASTCTIHEQSQWNWNGTVIHTWRLGDLREPVPFTGGVLIGDDFISELYVHMGYHPAWKYRDVHELRFENGRLHEARDLSGRIAELRAEVSSLHPEGQTIEAWVAQCFRLDYTSP